MSGRSLVNALASMTDADLVAFALREPQAFADTCRQVAALEETAQADAVAATEAATACAVAVGRLQRALDHAREAMQAQSEARPAH